MEILNIIFFIAFAAVSVSYGWGMRGTIIGGEKGAMLPGAFLGMTIALFSGSDVLASHPLTLAGVGALAMYCGGNMTYADTLALSMDTSPAPQMKKGMVALLIKGGIWFGLFGGYVSMFISVLSGFYSVLSLVIFFVCLPISALVFFKIFNTPFDPEKNKFPKIYFSVFRRETWGGLIGMLIEIVIFTAVMRDWSALAMTFGLFITGGVGWMLAQLFQIKAKHPGKKGKRLFDAAYANGLIDTWKIMECSLGALGGIGTAVTFLLSRNLFAEKLAAIDANGFHEILPDTASTIVLCVYGVILLADTLQYFILPASSKRYYKKLLSMKLITKEAYEDALKNEKPAESEHYKRYKKFCEHSEFAVYCVIPMMMCFFGAYDVAITASFVSVMLVLCQEVVEKCFGNKRGALFWKLVIFISVLMLFVTQAITGTPFLLTSTGFLYTFFYEVMYLVIKLLEDGKLRLNGSEKTVHGYFVICCLVINIFILAL